MQLGLFVRVFIASPGDVSDERDEACRVIHDWNAAHSLDRSILVEPVRVETHSQAVQGGHPQDLINGQLLERCDLLLAIFWTRLGTPTKKDVSGTVQEIREFAESKGAERVLLFFCEKELPSDVDIEQVKSVREFKKEMQDKGLYIRYKSEIEFARLFRQQLEMRMNSVLQSEEATEFLPNKKSDVRLEPECYTLLAAGSLAQHSNIMTVSDMSGIQVSANHTEYSKQGNGRSEARWKGAVEQLQRFALIRDVGYKGEVFELTTEGYKQADLLWCILLLRRIQESQKNEHDYIDPEDWIGQRVLAQTLEKSLLAEKMEELESMGAIDCVPMDGRVSSCRLSSAGRKTLREHGWVQFAEADASDN
jgi:hypothetical protein